MSFNVAIPLMQIHPTHITVTEDARASSNSKCMLHNVTNNHQSFIIQWKVHSEMPRVQVSAIDVVDDADRVG